MEPSLLLTGLVLTWLTTTALCTAPDPQQLADFIVGCSYKGAIAMSTDQSDLVPYWSHFGALGLATATALVDSPDPAWAGVAWSWLGWYRDHMDPTTGFVFDYTRDISEPDSDWQETGDMDSTDSYAAMYLVALYYTYKVDSNSTLLWDLADSIPLAVTAIEQTLNHNLTWAKPSYHIKYLMDNSEVVAGLHACEQLALALSQTQLANRCSSLASAVSGAIQTNLWRNEDEGWSMYMDEARNTESANWTILYADAVCQAWPTAFGAIPDNSPCDSDQIVGKLVTLHPQWCQPLEQDLFSTADGAEMLDVGWDMTPVGWSLLSIGDFEAAQEGAQQLWDAAVEVEMVWPFHCGACGELIFILQNEPLHFDALPDCSSVEGESSTSFSVCPIILLCFGSVILHLLF
ncbi:hypothetical protein Pelo_13001 [Pelomyxa schiedti]|nr:hypothetical protein Pelo_13001 [Pelomyxa schiedti]